MRKARHETIGDQNQCERHEVKRLAVLIFLLTCGVGVWYVATQTDLLTTARMVPPLPVFQDCSRVESEVNKYDWDRELALAVAKAESGCDANAHGDEDITFSDCAPEYADNSETCAEHQQKYGYSVGVFQVRILPGRETCDNYDTTINVKCAYQIYADAGRSFEPWSGYTTGKYKGYLWRTVEEVWG